MFILDDSKKTRWFPVEVEVFNDEGRKRTFPFDGEFAATTQDEVNETIKSGLTDIEIAERKLVGWRKIQTPDGSQLEVTDENRRRLVLQPGVARAIVKAWMKSVGIEAKN